MAFGKREWTRARDALARADADSPLSVEDLWRLSVASYLLGDEDAFVETLERVHRVARETADQAGAFRSAFWLGMHLGERGMGAQAGGWFGRAGRIVVFAKDHEDTQGVVKRIEQFQEALSAMRTPDHRVKPLTGAGRDTESHAASFETDGANRRETAA